LQSHIRFNFRLHCFRSSIRSITPRHQDNAWWRLHIIGVITDLNMQFSGYRTGIMRPLGRPTGRIPKLETWIINTTRIIGSQTIQLLNCLSGATAVLVTCPG
jgi:hypothetical protein